MPAVRIRPAPPSRRCGAPLVAGLLAWAASALPLTAGPPPSFVDVALEAGFQDRLAHGRALVAEDFDGDGHLDFYVGNPGEPVHFPDESLILLGDGPALDGDVSYRRGQVLLVGEIAFTASTADYDRDGDPDLFVGVGGQEGIGHDRLFRNDGGVMTDVSATAAIQGPWTPQGGSVPTATSSGTWADYDNDGDADLFVASRRNRESVEMPEGMGWRNSLFENRGDGTFVDVTEAAGVGATDSSMTAVWGDFDDDGWPDLYVPVHSPGFHLYRNQQDGTFREVPLPVDVGTRAVWASSVADFDGDGRLDVFSFGRGLPDNPDSHALLINRGGWVFTEEAEAAGLVPPGQPVPSVMGTALGDFDNDGWVDVYFGNGGPLFSERDTLFRNTTGELGALSFSDVSSLIDFPAAEDPACVPPPGAPAVVSPPVDHFEMLSKRPEDACGTAVDLAGLPLGPADPCRPTYPYRGHGSIFVDVDRDGDLDLAAVKGGTAIIAPEVSSTEPNRLFRNDGGNAGHWLFVELAGTVSNPDAFGARIELTTSAGGAEPRTRVVQWQGHTGFSASGPPEIHFGLGDHDAVDELVVTWPSGAETRLAGLEVDQRLALVEEPLWWSGFDDGSTDGWSFLSGTCAVEEGALGQRTGGRGLAVSTAAPTTDASIVARLTHRGGAGRIALLGRVSPEGDDFYGVQLSGGSARLMVSVDGVVEPLGEPLAIVPMTPGRSYLVRLVLLGDHIGFSVDRRQGGTVVDGRLDAGAVGLATFDTRAAFDNVAVF